MTKSPAPPQAVKAVRRGRCRGPNLAPDTAGRAGTWWLQGVLRNEAMVDGSQAAGPGPEATPQLSGHPDLSGHSFAPWKGGRGCQNPCAPPPGKGLRQSGGVASQGLLPRDNAETNSPETRTEAKPPTRLPCQVHKVALEANRPAPLFLRCTEAFGTDAMPMIVPHQRNLAEGPQPTLSSSGCAGSDTQGQGCASRAPPAQLLVAAEKHLLPRH